MPHRWVYYMCIYMGCPKKEERSIFVTLILKKNIFWLHQIKHCLLKRMIPRSFDLVSSIDSTTISWNTVIYKFCQICESYLQQVKQSISSLFVLFAQINGSQKSHYPWLKCHKNEEKIYNDYILRNDHRIKTTQPIWMISVSFFSGDNILSD